MITVSSGVLHDCLYTINYILCIVYTATYRGILYLCTPPSDLSASLKTLTKLPASAVQRKDDATLTKQLFLFKFVLLIDLLKGKIFPVPNFNLGLTCLCVSAAMCDKCDEDNETIGAHLSEVENIVLSG